MAIARRLRFEILRRDGYACRYCGAKAPDATLTIDHVIPIVLGGGDEPNNLVTACADCNGGKSSVPADAGVVEDVDAAAMLWAKAIERVNDRRRLEMVWRDEVVAAFDHRWNHFDSANGTVPRPADWRQSVERFLDQGLEIGELTTFLELAMNSKVIHREVWRYFCGCCWKEISKRQELARRLIEDGDI